jgi:hypothetical protein
MRQLSERHERILSDDVEEAFQLLKKVYKMTSNDRSHANLSVGGGGRCGGGGAVVAGELQGRVSQGVDGGAAGSTGWMQVVNPK